MKKIIFMLFLIISHFNLYCESNEKNKSTSETVCEIFDAQNESILNVISTVKKMKEKIDLIMLENVNLNLKSPKGILDFKKRPKTPQ